MVKCVVRKQKVYIFAGSKLTVLRKTDGKNYGMSIISLLQDMYLPSIKVITCM